MPHSSSPPTPTPTRGSPSRQHASGAVDAQADRRQGAIPRPPYFFRVGLHDAPRSRSVDGSTPCTARLARHSHDLGRWIDEIIDPWEKIRCDVYYGALVQMNFNFAGGVMKRVHIDLPRANPCSVGGPACEINQGEDEGLAFSTHLEHEQIGCR